MIVFLRGSQTKLDMLFGPSISRRNQCAPKIFKDLFLSLIDLCYKTNGLVFLKLASKQKMSLHEIITHPAIFSYLPKIIAASLILLATWIINILVQRSLNLVEKKGDYPVELFFLIRKIIKFVIYIIGLVTALEHLNAKVDTILTSLGVGGLAIGFALKDSLTNVVSGVVIIAYRPFSIGDYILLKTTEKTSFEGKIVGINFRYVTMEVDGNRTIIPNSTIVSSPVIVINKNINNPTLD